MNTRYLVFITLTIIFFSCKRHIVPDKESRTSTHSTYIVSSGLEASGETSPQHNSTSGKWKEVEKDDRPRKIINSFKQQITKDSAITKDLSRKELKKKIKENKKINKETDPRLSRALIMTIFGGIATTLGIVFMGYAPTGLFIFAFGIVFLVGIVSLIMYLANPKPKM